MLINRAKISTHWALDSTYNFTKDFNQILIMMFLDNITNKSYPFIFVLISEKTIKAYEKIFEIILDYI